jgi:hypothetical protein
MTTRLHDGYANSMVHAALRGGALPSLRRVAVDLSYDGNRAFFSGALLGAMQELHLNIKYPGDPDDLEPQLAALGLVRQLPALAELVLEVSIDLGLRDVDVTWPPFIPPSLKALSIVTDDDGLLSRSLVRALPGLLESSGARLDRLEIRIPSCVKAIAGGLVHVAQALRCCSPTLKIFRLLAREGAVYFDPDAGDYAAQAERLRVQCSDVMAAVSSCRNHLEVLVLPQFFLIEPLFPPGAVFGRLTHLQIWDCEREHTPDAGVLGLWELMASGGLPALATLKVVLGERRRLDPRVAPAFEGVAGTLTHLYLHQWFPPGWGSNEVAGAGYEIGVAVGKLRRLKDLALDISSNGRAYHGVARGLAASGGDRPLPLLWRLMLPSVEAHAVQVASLLLPSVRVFISSYHIRRMALLTACALRQAGYRHIWAFSVTNTDEDIKPGMETSVHVIAGCKGGDMTIQDRSWKSLKSGDLLP